MTLGCNIRVMRVPGTFLEVWKLMDGTKDYETIVAEVKYDFDGVPENISDEINAFISDLKEREFIGYELDQASE